MSPKNKLVVTKESASKLFQLVQHILLAIVISELITFSHYSEYYTFNKVLVLHSLEVELLLYATTGS